MRAYQTHYRTGTTHTATISGTAALVGSAFGSQTVVVRVVATTDCHLAFGTSNATPTATVNNPYLPANTVEYFTVSPGMLLSVIQSTAGGTGYATEMTQ